MNHINPFRSLRLLFLIAALALVLFFFRLFLDSANDFSCIQLSDPLHPYLRAIDFSFAIFLLTYVPVILFVGLHWREVQRLQVFVLAYIFIVLTRMLGIYLVPLCEPVGAIPLDDPLLGLSVYPGGYSAIDLMYSGHTATLFLVYLCWDRPRREVLFWCSLVAGALLVWQKVHYTVDVLVAFPVCWACWWVAKRVLKFGDLRI